MYVPAAPPRKATRRGAIRPLFAKKTAAIGDFEDKDGHDGFGFAPLVLAGAKVGAGLLPSLINRHPQDAGRFRDNNDAYMATLSGQAYLGWNPVMWLGQRGNVLPAAAGVSAWASKPATDDARAKYNDLRAQGYSPDPPWVPAPKGAKGAAAIPNIFAPRAAVTPSDGGGGGITPLFNVLAPSPAPSPAPAGLPSLMTEAPPPEIPETPGERPPAKKGIGLGTLAVGGLAAFVLLRASQR